MNIDELLSRVSKPSRYIGNEYNVVKKDWQSAELRMVLAFPDLYEIGMSHQGIQILYHIINQKSNYLAERVYAPDCDLEKLLREHGESLFSLESRRPLKEFDVLGITLPYELCYTNILTILNLSDIPFRSVERGEDDPLVIGGGPCAYHPEPVADFFDAILLGDGEEAIVAMADSIVSSKQAGCGRLEVLQKLSKITGVYVPSFFKPEYDENGKFSGIHALNEDQKQVTRTILPSLDNSNEIAPPLVPIAKIVHDRLGIEIARGCTRGCRFCQAGIIYRPVRERKPKKIMELAGNGITKGGFEEMALLSLSTGDYSCLSDLLTGLMNKYAKDNVSISMPSMRVGTLTQDIMEQIKRVRKTGFTIAPEAGTDRLRRIINKGITEEDLLQTCSESFELGWKLIKLYFMCGLPMETREDLEAIPKLLKKALAIAGHGKGRKINASVGVFVPKPHTPFQWEPQLSVEEGFERIFFLKDRLPKGAALKWNDPKLSFLEGVFSRGDRQLSSVVEEAWQCGARLDGWSEHFDLSIWLKAGQTCEIELGEYLKRRDFDAPLPWQHLSSGVDDAFLKSEYDKAVQEEYTPDCRKHGCQQCGLCDFKIVKPLTHTKSTLSSGVCDNTTEKIVNNGTVLPDDGHYYYQVNYSKTGDIKFIGHLELLQAVFRAIRRAGLPVNFSKGFHPTPKVSFGPALPVGTESLAEFFIVDLSEPLHDLSAWRELLNREMPNGLDVIDFKVGSKKLPVKVVTLFQIKLAKLVSSKIIDDFMKCSEYNLNLIRKKKVRKLNVRPMVETLSLSGDTVELSVISETGTAGFKPLELMADLFDLSETEVCQAKVIKKEFQELVP